MEEKQLTLFDNPNFVEMRPIPSCPQLSITADRRVWHNEKLYWVKIVQSNGNEFVRYNVPGGTKHHRTRIHVNADKALREAWPEMFPSKKLAYVKPEAIDLAEPGEEWRVYPLNPNYMISSYRRAWSWLTCRFVGKENRCSANAKRTVLMTMPSGQKEITIEKMYADTFGPDIPTIDGEKWKKDEEDGNLYVSNRGRFFSYYQQKIIEPTPHESGYLTVNARGKTMKAHRLVAMNWIPNPLDLPQVNHINENTHDNDVRNLEWCTGEYNIECFMRNHNYWYNPYHKRG